MIHGPPLFFFNRMDGSAVCHVSTNRKCELRGQAAFVSWNNESFHLRGVGERHYLCWRSSGSESSSIVDRIGTKDMCCVSVSHGMVLTFS